MSPPERMSSRPRLDAAWTRARQRMAKRIMDSGRPLGHSSRCEDSPHSSSRHRRRGQPHACEQRGGGTEPALAALRPHCPFQPGTRWFGARVWARRGGSAAPRRRSGSFDGLRHSGPARAGERAPTAGVLVQAPAAGRPAPRRRSSARRSIGPRPRLARHICAGVTRATSARGIVHRTDCRRVPRERVLFPPARLIGE